MHVAEAILILVFTRTEGCRSRQLRYDEFVMCGYYVGITVLSVHRLGQLRSAKHWGGPEGRL